VDYLPKLLPAESELDSLWSNSPVCLAEQRTIPNETPLDQIPQSCCWVFVKEATRDSSPVRPGPQELGHTKLDQEKLEKHKQYLIQLVGLAVQAAEPAISGEHHEKSIQIMEAIIDEIESLLVQEIPIVVVTVAMRLLIILRQKYSSLMEYHHLSKAKGDIVTDSATIPIQNQQQAAQTSSTSDDSTFTRAWSGFLSLFTVVEEKPKPAVEMKILKKKNSFSQLPGANQVSIHDFTIIKPISRGAYGRVFLCKKKDTGDIYAIKVLKKGDIIRKNQEDSIFTERNALVRAQHPFIVNLFYAFQSQDYVYITMEYLPGGDLSSLLEGLTYFEEPMVRAYIAEVVIVVEYLHSIGIVHRDLKPSNILIKADGHIKLTDFGLSKIGVWENQPHGVQQGPLNDLSTSGSNMIDGGSDAEDLHYAPAGGTRILGTPDYLSPEVLLGHSAGFSADWWAVGVMTFQLLTGATPYGDATPEAVFENILAQERYQWPSPQPIVSDEAKEFVERMLQYNPKDRLGTKGAKEIKVHPFFDSIEWDQVLTADMSMFFVPKLHGLEDTSYFIPPPNSHFSNTPFSPSQQPPPHGEENSLNPESGRRDFPNFAFKNIQRLREKNKNEILRIVEEEEIEASESSEEEEFIPEVVLHPQQRRILSTREKAFTM